MALSLQQTVEVLTQTGLVDSEEVRAFQRTQHITDGRQLAMALVNAGKLSPFQAHLLSQGKTNRLVFGEYVVVDKIGAGGMGEVYKAWHRRMDRFAAIKVLSDHVLDTAKAVERFYQEVKAAARLSHPNIVAALDAGERDGVHYFVMEYVDGKNLAEILQQSGPLPIQHALHYTVQTAHGLAYAHQNGIVHRDIKPANLILDKQGNIKILDMGLARLTEPGPRQEIHGDRLTEAGQVMGTAEYMAPEQAESSRDIDHRADIYSLGCTLYRLITGKPVFQGITMIDVILAHREKEKPSLILTRPDVPVNVDAVYQKMVAKDPDMRFQSMKAVTDALRPGLERDEKTAWADDNSAPQFQGMPLAEALSEAATQPPAAAPVLEKTAFEQPVAAMPQPAAEVTVDEVVPGQVVGQVPNPGIGIGAFLALISVAGVFVILLATGVIWLLSGDSSDPKEITENPKPKEIRKGNSKPKDRQQGPQPTDKRGLVHTYKGHLKAVNFLALSRDGGLLLSGSDDKTVRLWKVRTGECLTTLKGHADRIRVLDISPDGRVALSGGFEKTIKYWDLHEKKVLREFPGHADIVTGVRFSPAGGQIATGGFDHKLRVWDLATGKQRFEFAAHTSWVRGVAYSPDGKMLATCGNDSLGKIWKADTGKSIVWLKGHTHPVNVIAFSPDSKQVLTGSFDQSLRLWDIETGKTVQTFLGHTGSIVAVAVTPDGKHAVSASMDGTARLWRISDGRQIDLFQHSDGAARNVICSPDGRYIFTSGADSAIRLWRLHLPGLPKVADFLQR